MTRSVYSSIRVLVPRCGVCRHLGVACTPIMTTTSPRPIAAVFADRSYRWFWTSGFLVSVIFGASRFAWVWLVLELTDDARAAALTGMALGLPNLIISLPAGAWSDRTDRRRLLLDASWAGVAVLAGTALLVWTETMNLALALVTAFGVGSVVAVVQPVQTALIPQLVPEKLLMTGVALQNLSLQASFFIGALVSGAFIQAFGLTATFVGFAVIQLASGVALLPVRISGERSASRDEQVPAGKEHPSLLRSIRDGLVYSVATQPLRTLVLASFLVGLISASLSILLPQVAREELGQEAFAAGVLVGSLTVGMVITTSVLASRPNIAHKGLLFLLGQFSIAPMLIIQGISPLYAISLANAIFWGLPMGLHITLLRTLTQTHTSPEMMGRVMSVVHLLSRGTLPLASLGLIAMTSVWSAATSLVIFGVAIFGASVLIALPKEIRHA